MALLGCLVCRGVRWVQSGSVKGRERSGLGSCPIRISLGAGPRGDAQLPLGVRTGVGGVRGTCGHCTYVKDALSSFKTCRTPPPGGWTLRPKTISRCTDKLVSSDGTCLERPSPVISPPPLPLTSTSGPTPHPYGHKPEEVTAASLVPIPKEQTPIPYRIMQADVEGHIMNTPLPNPRKIPRTYWKAIGEQFKKKKKPGAPAHQRYIGHGTLGKCESRSRRRISSHRPHMASDSYTLPSPTF